MPELEDLYDEIKKLEIQYDEAIADEQDAASRVALYLDELESVNEEIRKLEGKEE